MPTYQICSNYNELAGILETYQRELRFSDRSQRIHTQQRQIFRTLQTFVQQFERYDSTETNPKRKAAFAELSMWIQDLTEMLVALRAFKRSLTTLNLYEKPDLSATVPDNIMRNLELKMQQSYKNMAELADNMILQPPAGSPFTNYKINRKQIMLLTEMLKATDELYNDPINADKMEAFSKIYSTLPSQTNWHQIARLGRVVLGLALIICAFVPPVTLIVVASFPVLAVSLFLAGAASCWSYLIAPGREIFRSNSTLRDLETLKKDMKSYQALPQLSLLRAAAVVAEPTLTSRDVEQSVSRVSF
jgi:hypothetical protein